MRLKHHPTRRLACALAAAVGLVAALPQAARAGDASAWETGNHSAVRLVAGAREGAALRAGIEIKLDRGFKTYWRYPGDSGMPPRFDFAQSENVKDVTVLWPAPKRFPDGGGGTSIGYGGQVILPLRVEPLDADKPVTLRLSIDYGVCDKLCIPVDAKLELALTGKPGANDAALAASEARVPKPVALGADAPVAIRTFTREAGDKPRIVVDVAAPAGAAVDLFAEGPAPDWALPLPQPDKAAPAGVYRFAFELDGLPPGASAAGATLRFTAKAGDAAIETLGRLD